VQALLNPFLTQQRKEKIATVLEKRLTSIEIACEAPTDIHNALAIVRTGEALGVTTIHIIDHELRKNEGKGTMQGSGVWSTVEFYRQFEDFNQRDAVSKPLLVGLDPHADHSISDIPIDEPLCLIFGNEKRGLTEEAKTACDMLCTIPMFGMAESFNLSVSAGIVLYELTTKKRATLNGNSEISDEERQLETTRAYIRTLGYENALRIVRDLKDRQT